MAERPYSRYTRAKTWAALYSQHLNAGYALVPLSATNNSIAVISCLDTKNPNQDLAKDTQDMANLLLKHEEECAAYYSRPEPTLDDIKQLAADLGVTFTSDHNSFKLRKSGRFDVHGTYHSNQGGFNTAFNILVRHQNSLSNTSPQDQIPAILAKARQAVVLARSSDYYHYHLEDYTNFKMVICGLHDSYLHLPIWEMRTNQRYKARETAVPITTPNFAQIRCTQFGHNILIAAYAKGNQDAIAFVKTLKPRTQSRLKQERDELQDQHYRGRPLAFLTEAERRKVGLRISEGLKHYYEQHPKKKRPEAS